MSCGELFVRTSTARAARGNKEIPATLADVGTYRPTTFSSVQFSSVQFSSVRFGSVQFSSVQFSSVQFSSVQFSLVRFTRECACYCWRLRCAIFIHAWCCATNVNGVCAASSRAPRVRALACVRSPVLSNTWVDSSRQDSHSLSLNWFCICLLQKQQFTGIPLSPLCARRRWSLTETTPWISCSGRLITCIYQQYSLFL